jgi:prepilin-type N-terminal cleavage/methylation domain-containing protein
MQNKLPIRGDGPSARSGGFTLIELLVVIAIIAILAAILFPVFAKARERAQLTACISNQKQLALAVFTYADDFDGRMPYGIPFADGTGRPGAEGYVGGFRQAKYSWMVHLLEPYVKTTDIFQCPNDDAGNAKLSNTANPGNKKDEVTYRFNRYATGITGQDGSARDGSTGKPFTPLTITQCANPSEFGLFRERFVSYHWKPTFTGGKPDYEKARSPQAMADGSVKMAKGGDAADNDPRPWQYWNSSWWWTGREYPAGEPTKWKKFPH